MTPYMGVGSECWSAVRNGRVATGIELKPTYFRQAAKNMESVDAVETIEPTLFDSLEDSEEECEECPI